MSDAAKKEALLQKATAADNRQQVLDAFPSTLSAAATKQEAMDTSMAFLADYLNVRNWTRIYAQVNSSSFHCSSLLGACRIRCGEKDLR